MSNTLDNFSLYLWDNGSEGYHVTVTTNYKLPTEKRSFFSFGGQTYKSWRQYNLSQPEPLKPYFAEFKSQYKQTLKTAQGNYWISKLGTNTGRKGRRTAPGVMILLEEQGNFHFVMDLNTQYFEGEFDYSQLSDAQRKGSDSAKGVCIGAFKWRRDDDQILEYAEAF